MEIAFVCRAGPFVLGEAMGVSNVTFGIPCKRSGPVLRLSHNIVNSEMYGHLTDYSILFCKM